MWLRCLSCCVIAAMVTTSVACGSREPAPNTQTMPYPTGTLEQMLAPIALYPDQLLAQILMSASDPAKVTELDKWLKSNQKLKGTALQDAAVKAGFEPSFVALALFPQVVAKMAQQIAWTTLLGQTFASNRDAVFASIQKLRLQAKNLGTLKTTPQQEVETRKTSSGEQVIVIEPANPQIVYVPQYNPQVVYTQAPSNTTVVVQQPPSNTTVIVEQDNDADVAVAAGLIGFTAGIVIGAAVNNNYYYGPYGWRGGAYMYNDAWNDYYDHREDARDDWMDHREDLVEERSDRLENRSEQRTDRLENTQDQRTERQDNRQENRPAAQEQRTQRQETRQQDRPAAQEQRAERATQAQTQRATQAQSASPQAATAQAQRPERTGSTQARGYSDSSSSGSGTRAAPQRSGGSDAFSGYSSGASQRAESSRGQRSRSSARSGGGGGGGGRRR